MIIRKLWSWEWDKLHAHLLRLDREDRRLRFCRPVSDAFIHRYCQQIDRIRTTVTACFVDDTLRGAAELVRISDDLPARAELALSVEAGFQGRGIGARLLDRALLHARNRFVDTVYMYSLRDNARIQRLVRRYGANVTAHEATSEGSIHLPWPSHLSLFEELSGDGQALIAAAFELPTRRTQRDASERVAIP